MNYLLYKMSFKTALHVGKKLITDGEYTIPADTIFSALCQEALKMGGSDKIEELVNLVKNNKLQISDAFPFINDTFYIPKPFLQIERKEDNGSSVIKKHFKKLSFIPVNIVNEFVKGDFNPIKANEELADLGKYSVQARVLVDLEQDSEPYAVGTYKFGSKSGLYVYIGYEEDDSLIYKLFNSLSYTGIGGKVSSGLGKFVLTKEELPPNLKNKLNKQSKINMSLSISMPKEEELEESLKDACYLIERRGGFVQSTNYSDEMVRKNDFYSFKSGSCFSKMYKGDIYDVSSNGNHPVYRYAKPMFLEVIG